MAGLRPNEHKAARTASQTADTAQIRIARAFCFVAGLSAGFRSAGSWLAEFRGRRIFRVRSPSEGRTPAGTPIQAGMRVTSLECRQQHSCMMLTRFSSELNSNSELT